jgi:TRAP-type C4-dicarboxylate transport system permease small subunit
MRWHHLHNAVEGVSRLFAILVGYALLLLSIFVCLEILLRRFVGYSLQGVDEVGGYVLAVTCAFGFGYALLHRAHTRIDIVLARAPSAAQAALNVLALVILAAIAGFMAWRAWAVFRRSLELGSISATPLQTPIWIPQAFWIAGLMLFAAVALMLALRGLFLLFRGASAVNRELGPVTLQQEIEEEIEKAGVREPRAGAD